MTNMLREVSGTGLCTLAIIALGDWGRKIRSSKSSLTAQLAQVILDYTVSSRSSWARPKLNEINRDTERVFSQKDQ